MIRNIILTTLLWASLQLMAEETLNIPLKAYPLFEMGAGMVNVQFPDYPGASHSRSITLPFPSLTFRGDVLRSTSDEGVRGRFFNSDRFELDFSADGSLASDVSDNKVREGMPDLDTVLELGPSLIMHLKKPQRDNQWKIDLHIPLRYVFSTDLNKAQELGATINPFIQFQMSDLFHDEDLLLFTYGMKYATERIQDYYYEVAPQYQTANRPAFDAQSGFMEQSSSLLIYQPITPVKGLWVFGGLIRSDYTNAVNRQSTLLAEDVTISYAVGIYYNFYRSPFLVYE